MIFGTPNTFGYGVFAAPSELEEERDTSYWNEICKQKATPPGQWIEIPRDEVDIDRCANG